VDRQQRKDAPLVWWCVKVRKREMGKVARRRIHYTQDAHYILMQENEQKQKNKKDCSVKEEGGGGRGMR